jgi:hypothetical protein
MRKTFLISENNIPANDTDERRFSPEHLVKARSLYDRVQADRFTTPTMSTEEERLLCLAWASEARLLMDRDLGLHDLRACRWVLYIVRAIAAGRFFVFGLSRSHDADWRSRLRQIENGLRVERQKHRLTERHRKSPSPRLVGVEPALPELQNLSGRLVLVVGGEPDDAVLDHFQEAEFALHWVPDNIRRVQAAEERIRKGRVDGVVLLIDLNGHVTFAMVRNACRARGTPFITGTKGVAGVSRALAQLDEQLDKVSA